MNRTDKPTPHTVVRMLMRNGADPGTIVAYIQLEQSKDRLAFATPNQLLKESFAQMGHSVVCGQTYKIRSVGGKS